MNILVISPYPNKEDPRPGIFVYNLVQKIGEIGHQVVVVSPIKYPFPPWKAVGQLPDIASVYQPKTLSFSNKRIGCFDAYTLTRFFRARTLRKSVKNINFKPDVVYCHFLASALSYFQAFPDTKTPVYVAVGENAWMDSLCAHYYPTHFSNILSKIKGFIAVSQLVKKKLMNMGVKDFKIRVVPNATDLSLFRPRDKEPLRRRYGFPITKKIIIFVGNFIESKGPLRVQAALNLLPEDVVALFAGKGPQTASHPRIIVSGVLKHNEVADFMALSDVFVLPTLHEGSSNVIVEAMASGLPIVSSDIHEIREQCNASFSILVNPLSVEEIASALNRILFDDTLRSKMGANALDASKEYDINKRAEKIISCMSAYNVGKD